MKVVRQLIESEKRVVARVASSIECVGVVLVLKFGNWAAGEESRGNQSRLRY